MHGTGAVHRCVVGQAQCICVRWCTNGVLGAPCVRRACHHTATTPHPLLLSPHHTLCYCHTTPLATATTPHPLLLPPHHTRCYCHHTTPIATATTPHPLLLPPYHTHCYCHHTTPLLLLPLLLLRLDHLSSCHYLCCLNTCRCYYCLLTANPPVRSTLHCSSVCLNTRRCYRHVHCHCHCRPHV